MAKRKKKERKKFLHLSIVRVFMYESEDESVAAIQMIWEPTESPASPAEGDGEKEPF